jgi:hypothetical protein
MFAQSSHPPSIVFLKMLNVHKNIDPSRDDTFTHEHLHSL